MNHRFKVGDRVQVGGLLADFYGSNIGLIVSLEPNSEGIRELDLYHIEMPGFAMADTRLADFQLTSAPQPLHD